MEKTVDDLVVHLDRVEGMLNEVLGLLRPVHEHTEWVDSLRDTLQ